MQDWGEGLLALYALSPYKQMMSNGLEVYRDYAKLEAIRYQPVVHSWLFPSLKVGRPESINLP